MRPFLTLTLILVATASFGVVAGVPVGADDIPTNDTETSAPAAECTETVTDDLAICDASLEGSELVIDLYSNRSQVVVLTEAFRKGSGHLEQRSAPLREGRNTVRLTVTVDGGSEGFTIASRDVLYQREVKAGSSLFSGPWNASDTQAAGLGSGLAVAIVTLTMVFRARIGGDDDVERIA